MITACLALTAWGLGLRINLTPSCPLGIYQLARDMNEQAPLAPGQQILFCVSLNAPFLSEAMARGYITRGLCQGGLAPLLKPIAALPGDVVTVRRTGVSVNGRQLPNSALATQDSSGRPLPSAMVGTHRVGIGDVWVISTHHALSFDSRYFGPVSVSAIQGTVKPLWVF